MEKEETSSLWKPVYPSYKIKEVIGKGANGEVVKAIDR